MPFSFRLPSRTSLPPADKPQKKAAVEGPTAMPMPQQASPKLKPEPASPPVVFIPIPMVPARRYSRDSHRSASRQRSRSRKSMSLRSATPDVGHHDLTVDETHAVDETGAIDSKA